MGGQPCPAAYGKAESVAEVGGPWRPERSGDVPHWIWDNLWYSGTNHLKHKAALKPATVQSHPHILASPLVSYLPSPCRCQHKACLPRAVNGFCFNKPRANGQICASTFKTANPSVGSHTTCPLDASLTTREPASLGFPAQSCVVSSLGQSWKRLRKLLVRMSRNSSWQETALFSPYCGVPRVSSLCVEVHVGPVPPELLSLVLRPFLSSSFFLQILYLSFWVPNCLCNSPHLPSTNPKKPHSLFLRPIPRIFRIPQPWVPASPVPQRTPRLGLRRATGTCCSSATSEQNRSSRSWPGAAAYQGRMA